MDQKNTIESSGINHVEGTLLYKIRIASQIHGETMNYLIKWFAKSESQLNPTHQRKLRRSKYLKVKNITRKLIE